MRLNLGSFLYPAFQEMVQPSIPGGQYVDVIIQITSRWQTLTGTSKHTQTTTKQYYFETNIETERYRSILSCD